MQYGFYFDHNRCVKCHACEIACKTWNEVEIGPRWREVVKIESGIFPNVKSINVSMACMHCGDAPCKSACPVNAISKQNADGIVQVDQNKCIGCGLCTWACPFNAPQLLTVKGKMEKCTFCQTPGKVRPPGMPRACEEICPTGAIRSGPMHELATLNRETAARRMAGADMRGLPGLIVGAAQQFGPPAE